MVVDVLSGGEFDGGPGGGPGGDPEWEAMEAKLCELARMAAAFEASGAWQRSGARSAGAWLKHHCRLSSAEAARHLKRGRALRHLPLVDQAFGAGAITGDHVALLLALDHGATKEPFRHQDQLLVDLARTRTFDPFKRTVDDWRRRHDPDGTTEEAEEKRNRRGAYLVEGIDGVWLGQMTLDPVSGTIVAGELDRLEQLLFEADWSEATERLGRTPLTSELLRTPTQRRADAYVWMARRSASRPPGAGKSVPVFHVHVGWETVHGSLSELEDGPIVPTGQLLTWIDGADITWIDGADIVRVTHHPEGPVTMGHTTRMKEVTVECLHQAVFDAPDRKECNPTDRLFTGATRRAIEIRDRQCTHPYCDVPARLCEVDHIKPYTQGGLTTQQNGRLLCRFHNRLAYQREQRFGQRRTCADEQAPRRE